MHCVPENLQCVYGDPSTRHREKIIEETVAEFVGELVLGKPVLKNPVMKPMKPTRPMKLLQGLPKELLLGNPPRYQHLEYRPTKNRPWKEEEQGKSSWRYFVHRKALKEKGHIRDLRAEGTSEWATTWRYWI